MPKYSTEDLAKMHKYALWHAKKFWNEALKVYGARIGQMPDVKMNSRLTSTGGRAWLNENLIDLSCYLMCKYPEYFAQDTIPHELCHHIAWRLHNDNGHGKAWKTIMREMGLEPNVYHKMETMNQAKARMAKQ